tara:strand:+ start:2548 stop:3039 length:492 start_codon:yes stop_codon:yes gene_type:complete
VGAKVKITMDMPMNLMSILFESEMVILEELGEESVELAQSMWTGWAYAPYGGEPYPEAQKGTSFAGWKFRLLQASKNQRGVEILNNAKDIETGEEYAGKVHRARTPKTDVVWLDVLARMKKELIPEAMDRLMAEFKANANRSRTVIELESNRASEVGEVFEIE